MDTQFINLFLLIFIINIFGRYIYQQNNKNLDAKLNNNTNNIDTNNINMTTDVMYINTLLNKQGNIINENSECYLNREAERILGPVRNFHQKFNNQLYNLDTKFQQKNANPLGWRKHYITKNNKFLVPMDKNFDNIVTKNYLKNLENVDNLYRKGCN